MYEEGWAVDSCYIHLKTLLLVVIVTHHHVVLLLLLFLHHRHAPPVQCPPFSYFSKYFFKFSSSSCCRCCLLSKTTWTDRRDSVGALLFLCWWFTQHWTHDAPHQSPSTALFVINIFFLNKKKEKEIIMSPFSLTGSSSPALGSCQLLRVYGLLNRYNVHLFSRQLTALLRCGIEEWASEWVKNWVCCCSCCPCAVNFMCHGTERHGTNDYFNSSPLLFQSTFSFSFRLLMHLLNLIIKLYNTNILARLESIELKSFFFKYFI